MEFSELEHMVIEWAEERGLLKRGNYFAQFTKTVEEVGELAAAIIRHNTSKVIDSFGDIIVTLIILSATTERVSMTACLEKAYYEIKNRKGIVERGIFLKEEEE